jgi:hypothetical protein
MPLALTAKSSLPSPFEVSSCRRIRRTERRSAADAGHNWLGEAIPVCQEHRYASCSWRAIRILVDSNQIWLAVPIEVRRKHVEHFSICHSDVKCGCNWAYAYDVQLSISVGIPNNRVRFQYEETVRLLKGASPLPSKTVVVTVCSTVVAVAKRSATPSPLKSPVAVTVMPLATSTGD